MNLVDELKKASYVIPNEKEQDFLTVINLSEAIEIANILTFTCCQKINKEENYEALNEKEQRREGVQ